MVLWEARPNDPAVPQGKVLARIGGEQPPLPPLLLVVVPVMLQCLQMLLWCWHGCLSGRQMHAVSQAPRQAGLLLSHEFGSARALTRALTTHCSTCLTAALSQGAGEDDQHGAGSCTYLLNSQSVEALAFRVDVVSRRDSALLARCYIEPPTLQVCVRGMLECLQGRQAWAALVLGACLHGAGGFPSPLPPACLALPCPCPIPATASAPK